MAHICGKSENCKINLNDEPPDMFWYMSYCIGVKDFLEVEALCNLHFGILPLHIQFVLFILS